MRNVRWKYNLPTVRPRFPGHFSERRPFIFHILPSTKPELINQQRKTRWSGTIADFVGRENLRTNAKKKRSEQKCSRQGPQDLLFLPQSLTISVTLPKLCNKFSGPNIVAVFSKSALTGRRRRKTRTYK